MWSLSTSSFPEAIGLLGVFTYLGSYFALQAGFIRGQTYVYAILNIIAPSCVLYDLQTDFNQSSALIQISWITISLVGIARLFYISIAHKFNDEEQGFISEKLPDLPKNLTRRFLKSGRWIDVEPGSVLTTEGQLVPQLIYLATGEVDVHFSDNLLVTMAGNQYIGEITCLSKEPATATVVAKTKLRCFCIRAEKLRKLTDRNENLRQSIETSFAGDVRHKLLLTNNRQKDLVG